MHNRLFLTAASLALLASCSSGSNNCALIACGGPGGGTGGGLMTVTQDNALDALREAWYTATVTGDVPFLVLATNIGDTSGGLVGLPVAGGVNKVGAGPRISLVPFGPDSYNCPVSGTFTVQGDVTDALTVTVGDTASYQSFACDSGTGYTVDGDHAIFIDGIVGDPTSGSFEQGQTLGFTNFQAVSALRDITLNGDHIASIDTQPLNAFTSTFSGSSLVMTEGQSTITATSFSGSLSVQTAAPFAFTLGGRGNGNSSIIQGSFDYLVEETIQQFLGEFPSDGIVDIFGTNLGTARMAIMDATFVRIQVDANASGNYEISVDMSWDEFLDGTGTINFAPVMPE